MGGVTVKIFKNLRHERSLLHLKSLQTKDDFLKKLLSKKNNNSACIIIRHLEFLVFWPKKNTNTKPNVELIIFMQ